MGRCRQRVGGPFCCQVRRGWVHRREPERRVEERLPGHGGHWRPLGRPGCPEEPWRRIWGWLGLPGSFGRRSGGEERRSRVGRSRRREASRSSSLLWRHRLLDASRSSAAPAPPVRCSIGGGRGRAPHLNVDVGWLHAQPLQWVIRVRESNPRHGYPLVPIMQVRRGRSTMVLHVMLTDSAYETTTEGRERGGKDKRDETPVMSILALHVPT